MKRQAGPAAWGLVAVALAACGSDHTGVKPGAVGGSTAAAGGGGLGGGGASGAGAGGGDAGGATGGGATNPCPEARQLVRPGGTQVDLAFAPTLAGKPFVFGEPNPMTGGQLSPTNIRFYVSELSLLAVDGSSIAVDLVSSAGTPEPYGVHLVNLEEPGSMVLHVLAPPGSYSGGRFTWGLNDACNSGDSNRGAPLSFNSQMAWPHLAGFLFLRYEAQWTADVSAAATAPVPPTMIHMGGLVGSVFAPQATVTGAFTVPATGSLSRTIQMSFDAIFQGASSSEDASNVLIPTPEVIAGERLRRAVPALPIFTLAEP
jgi:hypothetical protein